MDLQKYFSTHGIKGNIQRAIAPATAETLQAFCEQESEFAQAVEQSDKSFQQCLDSIAGNAGRSISDLEVYRQAVSFYFPGAKVHCRMVIDLIGEAAEPSDKSDTATGNTKSIAFDFDSLLDF